MREIIMTFSGSKYAVGSLALALSVAATGVSAESISGQKISAKQLTAIDAPLPEYPKHADIVGIDGYAVLEFTVSPEGRVDTPVVTSYSSPVFSKAAITAVESWQFEPVYENGIAVPIRTGYKFSFVPRTAE